MSLLGIDPRDPDEFKSDETEAGCPFGDDCVLVLPHSPSECVVQATSKPKTNRQHAEAELEGLRQQLAGDAARRSVDAVVSHLRLVVSKNVRSLGDVAEVLYGLQHAGVTRENLDYVLDRVWTPGAWEDRPAGR